MQEDDFYYLGKILRAKGTQGEVKVSLDVDMPEEYKDLKAVFVEKRNDLVPYLIENIQLQLNKANIKFQDVTSAQQAGELAGCSMFLPIDTLPLLKGNKFYYHEVTGFDVIDKTHGNIGIIEQVLDFPNNPLFQIKYKEKEILIPITDDIVTRVDRVKKQIRISAPEGLIEIYI